MDMIVKSATVKKALNDGTGIEVQLPGQTTNLAFVKNATGRTVVQGQRVLIHYRQGALTPNDPAYITAILEGAVD
jgi:hypothetical protein